MSSSPTSSSESSSPNSSSTLPKFDPFAVHPFTNCSHVNQSNTAPYNPNNASYGYAYGPNVGSYNSRHAPQVPSQTTNNAAPSIPSRIPTTPYGHPPRPAGIFVPFRKDTSSPELDDVLKSKKIPTKTTATHPTSPSTTGNPAKPIPISNARKY